MRRSDATACVGEVTSADDLFVVAVGPLQDDWWNHRPGGPGAPNSFSMALMGGPTPLGLGLALAVPNRRVVVLDGDGSLLMNLAVLCTLGRERPENLTVVVFDNGIYEGAGGLPTAASEGADLVGIAAAAGVPNCAVAASVKLLREQLGRILNSSECGLIVAKIDPGVYEWPPDHRMPTDGIEEKYRFVRHIESTEGIIIHAGAARKPPS